MRELEYRPESSLGFTSDLSAEVARATPPDLVTWLREQIDEDGRVAQSVDPKSVGWLADYGEDCALPGAGKAVRSFADPARALREVEAKRRIIDALLVAEDREIEATCWIIAKGVLRLLALPYADRPGYREEWRP